MKNTTDLWFASYLKVMGYKLIDFDLIAKGKGRYYFEISEEKWKIEKLAFHSSDASKLKSVMEELKDLLY